MQKADAPKQTIKHKQSTTAKAMEQYKLSFITKIHNTFTKQYIYSTKHFNLLLFLSGEKIQASNILLYLQAIYNLAEIVLIASLKNNKDT